GPAGGDRIRFGEPTARMRTSPVYRVESAVWLSDIDEIRQTAISAADSGEVQECRHRLGRGDLPDHERARLYCRLSAALYHQKSFDEAVECARTAFDLQPESDEIANICAWVFS